MIARAEILQESIAHHRSNRLQEAEKGYEKILQFYPDDPDANFLLGTIHYSKNQYDAAFNLITKAISLRDNISIYYNNLGLVLYGQGKAQEAMQCYLRALQLDANQFLAYYNIGLIHRDNGERNKEIEFYNKTLSINPTYTQALHCLGDAFRDQGNIQESITYYERAISSDSTYPEAFTNLVNVSLCMGDIDAAFRLLQNNSLPASNDRFSELSIVSDLMIILWSSGDIDACRKLAIDNRSLLETPTTKRNKSYLFYFDYLSKLIQHRDDNPEYFQSTRNCIPTHVFGDSHVLSYANVILNKEKFVGHSHLIRGIKMWHLSNPNNHFFRPCLKEQLNKLGENQHLLFTIGEIDCRPDEGIWKAYQNGKGFLRDIINETIHGYISWLTNNIPPSASVTISGIPAPAYPLMDNNNDRNEFIGMIRQVNCLLRKSVISSGWSFLDVYSLTVNEQGVSNKKWHIDDYHLQPKFLSGVNL